MVQTLPLLLPSLAAGLAALQGVKAQDNYVCDDVNYFTQNDAYLWSELYCGDDSYAFDPCQLLTSSTDLIASSDIDDSYDYVAVGGYDIQDYTVARIKGRDIDPSKPYCIDVKAQSRTLYAHGTNSQVEAGHLGLHVNVCFQNGQIIVDAAKNTPFIEPLPYVDADRTNIGYQWSFDKQGSNPSGIIAGCENNCGQYRITYQGSLIQKAEGAAGAGATGGGTGAKVEGNIKIDRPGQLVRITIVVRATDGAAFCAPAQGGGNGGTANSCTPPSD